MFFAIKSSFETSWFSGILIWLLASPHVSGLEGKYTSVVMATSILGAIVVGGYAAAISTVRISQRLAAIGTSVASAIFYHALENTYPWLGYQFEQFGQHPTISFIVIASNIIVAIIVSVLLVKERDRTKELAPQ
jgi:hypothetical protein